MKRGEVVIVSFPFADGSSGKVRPALVIQSDNENQRLSNTVIAMITGNLKHATETSVLVDPTLQQGKSSGLHGPSLVKCTNLYTIRQADVITTIGMLSTSLIGEVDNSLKVALGLS